MTTIERTAHAASDTARVVEEAVHVVRDDLDWATVREAATLAAVAAWRFAQWWLCGHGVHLWQAWEYDDGSVVEECDACGRQRDVDNSTGRRPGR